MVASVCMISSRPASRPANAVALPAANAQMERAEPVPALGEPCQKTGQQAVSRAGGAPNLSFRCGQAVKVA